MACSNCSGCSTEGKKTEDGVTGCKNNGLCKSGGCNKLNVFDWLGNMDEPKMDRFDIVEVRFRNGRKAFFRNEAFIDIITGDPIVVEMQSGYHLGYVSLQGELVRIQMKKRKVKIDEDIKNILRIATPKDLEKYTQVNARNLPTLHHTRQIIRDLGLKMKLSDVEFQLDNSKATFYYSADERVDFRELIKVLAAEFKIRVEMKQISLRQEAGMLGGIGSCGRELCCSTWLQDFISINTGMVRYQNLSLNPNKLSGQCGRLKCCLNYELSTYKDALKDIPKVNTPLLTSKGKAILQKTDIFRKIMWFAYKGDTTWHPLSTERVTEILAMNKEDITPESLLSNEVEVVNNFEKQSKLLERLDKKKKKKKNNRSGNKPKPKPNSNQTNAKKNTQKRTGNTENKGKVRKNRSFKNKRNKNDKTD